MKRYVAVGKKVEACQVMKAVELSVFVHGAIGSTIFPESRGQIYRRWDRVQRSAFLFPSVAEIPPRCLVCREIAKRGIIARLTR